jgi:hypothetical protein
MPEAGFRCNSGAVTPTTRPKTGWVGRRPPVPPFTARHPGTRIDFGGARGARRKSWAGSGGDLARSADSLAPRTDRCTPRRGRSVRRGGRSMDGRTDKPEPRSVGVGAGTQPLT